MNVRKHAHDHENDHIIFMLFCTSFLWFGGTISKFIPVNFALALIDNRYISEVTFEDFVNLKVTP